MVIKGKIVDIINKNIFNGIIEIEGSRIKKISKVNNEFSNYILPGLIDSHVHIESSMLTPTQFSKLVVPRGTVAVVSDPHEIANILGIEGVNYMIDDANNTPLKCYFGAPSCVPATSFETSGAIIDSKDIDNLLARKDIYFLSEMMNFPGVINKDKEVWSKIESAKKYNKKIDGHAPGLVGDDLLKYTKAGISSDHECVNIKEAVDKINNGVVVQIREGSAAKNFNSLYSLLNTHPNDIMLCTDDSHPDEIITKGHIDKIIRLGINKGMDIFSLLRAAILKPVEHYNLDVGLLREGDSADFIVVDNLKEFNIKATYINGKSVYLNGKLQFDVPKSSTINNFNISSISKNKIQVTYKKDCQIRVIECIDGDLLTSEILWSPNNSNGFIEPDINKDILKIVVLNRYKESEPVVGFIKNIGLKKGAIACSVAHDSHNLIAVGVSDIEISSALNEIIKHKGGISIVSSDEVDCLPLEVAGLMTSEDGIIVAKKYEELNSKAQKLGSTLSAPFMTLSFMSLLVIPKLKIGDKGLFDVSKFLFTDLYV